MEIIDIDVLDGHGIISVAVANIMDHVRLRDCFKSIKELSKEVELLREKLNEKNIVSVDVIKMGIESELIEEIQKLREALQLIVDADWRKWQELASPEEFVRWAKSRANHALMPTRGSDNEIDN